jgi:hypothetical protein
MSKVVDMSSVCADPLGDEYASLTHLAMGRPLDLARLVYVKLVRGIQIAGLEDQVGEEVWWNHFHADIIVQVFNKHGDDKIELRLLEGPMARQERLRSINNMVAYIVEMIKEW